MLIHEAYQPQNDREYRLLEELGLKAAAAILLVGARRLLPCTEAEGIGLHLLERDDEMPRLKAGPC